MTLEIMDETAAAQLRAGMTVTVRIDTGHQRDLRESARRMAERWGLHSVVSFMLSESRAEVGPQ